ncbi:thioesterase, partial [Enterobacter intestinihominis]
LEVNANHIRSVRSGRVRGGCRRLPARSPHHVWPIDILDQHDSLCC